MRCSKCGTEGILAKKFCAECGSPSSNCCANCGSDNALTAKFCGDCGAPLTPAAATPASPESPPAIPAFAQAVTDPRPSPDGEPRHLTVLFCDLAGSTALSAGLDPEDWRATVATYHRAAAAAITRFGGHVAKYLGDGVMAFFGYPEAHDDDAERAVRAGLAILDALAALNESAAHPRLAARIGLDSGRVVVGLGAGPDADVFGDTPNIAARVQATADPDSVLVTAATQRLIHGLFIVENRGTQPLKGIAEPLELYRVVRPSGARGRLEASATSRGLTPFVGRDDELRTLAHRWERARDGEGQVVLVIGEAGIGKSRLLHRFHETLADTPHAWIEAGASPFFQNTPFYPVIDMLRQFLGTSASDPIAKLKPRLLAAGLRPQAALPLLAPLLNMPLPAKYTPSLLSPEQQRRQLLATLVEWILGSARNQPVIIATEDLHWIDPSTLELIQLLVEQGAHARLLLLYTARPEFRPPWQPRSHHMQVTLDRLGVREIRTIVAQVAASKALTDETIAAVVERTAGVPLFVEELTRAVLECNSTKLSGSAIPATLHDSLMARLDRLGSAKEAIQLGAVLGNDFSYELLHAVHLSNDDELQRYLRTATDAELLYVRGLPPDATYQFKHALIRDAAYEALLKSRRRELHNRIAATLQEKFPEQVASHPEILAYHSCEAGLVEQAVRHWRKAGRRAIERSANVEAVAQLRKALDLIKTLPSTSERLMEEVRLQSTLFAPLIAIHGYTALEVENACNRAFDLCQQLGEAPQLFTVLGGLNSIFFNRGDSEIALELGKRMLRMAQTQRDPVMLLWGHYSLGFTLRYQGQLRPARDHLERSLALYDPKKGGTYGFVQDPGPTAMALLSHVIHSLGYPDQALEKMLRAVTLARELSHPFTLAWVFGSAGELYWRRGEKLAAQGLMEEKLALCDQQGFKPMSASALFWLGLASVEQGGGKRALTKMHDSLRGSWAGVSNGDQIRALGLLALAQGKAGQPDLGLATIDEAFASAKTPNDASHLHLYRYRGQLLLMKNKDGFRKAKQSFRTAIELAGKLNAKSDELRGVTELARLLAQEGRRDQARKTLTGIYNWFTEGFDTADLKDAKALLDELSA